jgi:aminoglycoside phosphotransferase (APT) family kinase protein
VKDKIHTWVLENGLHPIQQTILTDRPGHLVAKVETRTTTVVIKAPLYDLEVAANERLAAAGLPVPRILAGGNGYLMMEWIEGEGLSSTSPNSAQLEAGRLLRQVHELGGGPPYKGNESFTDWMRGWLNHAMQWWEPGPTRLRETWSWFEDLTPLIDTRGHDLMLMDGRPDHFLVRDGKIVGLIDVSEICPGDGAMDLAVMGVSDPVLLPGVLAGYGPPAPDRELIDFYLFLRRLAAAEFNLNRGNPALAGRILRLVQEDLR